MAVPDKAAREAFAESLQEEVSAYLRATHPGSRVYSHVYWVEGPGGEYALEADFNIETKTGRRSIRLERNFNWRVDKVEHAYFAMSEELQSKGVSPYIQRKFLDFYDKTGIRRITTDANMDVGGYVWKQYGFRASDFDMSRLTGTPYDNKLRLLEAWQAASKEQLLGTSWEGFMDLNDPAQRKVYEDYIRKQGARSELYKSVYGDPTPVAASPMRPFPLTPSQAARYRAGGRFPDISDYKATQRQVRLVEENGRTYLEMKVGSVWKPAKVIDTGWGSAAGVASARDLQEAKVLGNIGEKLGAVSGDTRLVAIDQFLDDPDLDMIARRGMPYGPAKIRLNGLPDGECHWNTAQLFAEGKIDQIVVGYARNEFGWHQHTWGLKDGKVVETTASNFDNTHYFGAPLDDAEARAFVKLTGDNPSGGGMVRTSRGGATLDTSPPDVDVKPRTTLHGVTPDGKNVKAVPSPKAPPPPPPPPGGGSGGGGPPRRRPTAAQQTLGKERMERLLQVSERRIRTSFNTVIGQLKGELDINELADLITAGRMEEAISRLDDAGRALGAVANKEYVAAAEEAAEFLRGAGVGRIQFDQVNTRAVAAMQRNTLRLVSNFSAEQAAATRAAITEGITAGANPRDVARRFRDSIGLTQRQQAAVDNYRRLLGGSSAQQREALSRELHDSRFGPRLQAGSRQDLNPLTPDQIDRMVGRYAERYVKYRSEVIARTEGLRSVHEGVEELFEQAFEGGVVGRSELIRTWDSSRDGRVRDSHKHLHGLQRQFGESFPGAAGPIRFPGDPEAPGSETIQCRCLLTTRMKPTKA